LVWFGAVGLGVCVFVWFDGLMRFCVTWSGDVWCGLMCFGVAWYIWYGFVWFHVVWYGLSLSGLVWVLFDVVWFGVVRCS
jgi:hypothetical protein